VTRFLTKVPVLRYLVGLLLVVAFIAAWALWRARSERKRRQVAAAMLRERQRYEEEEAQAREESAAFQEAIATQHRNTLRALQQREEEIEKVAERGLAPLAEMINRSFLGETR